MSIYARRRTGAVMVLVALGLGIACVGPVVTWGLGVIIAVILLTGGVALVTERDCNPRSLATSFISTPVSADTNLYRVGPGLLATSDPYTPELDELLRGIRWDFPVTDRGPLQRAKATVS